jgi:hypothetical protein
MILEFYGAYSTFFNAVVLGIFFGIIYDIFRILRISRLPYLKPVGRFYEIIQIPKQKNFLIRKFSIKFIVASNTVITFIEDIVFWTIASIGHILFIYHVNGGVVRIYFIMCTFLGASLYFFSIGKITMYFSVRIIFVVRCFLYWAFRIIIYPISLILRLFKNVARFLALITFIPINNFIRNRRLSSYSKKRVSHILLQSKKGFYI